LQPGENAPEAGQNKVKEKTEGVLGEGGSLSVNVPKKYKNHKQAATLKVTFRRVNT